MRREAPQPFINTSLRGPKAPGRDIIGDPVDGNSPVGFPEPTSGLLIPGYPFMKRAKVMNTVCVF